MKHLSNSVEGLQASHERLSEKVDGIDRKLIAMVAAAAGGGTAVVQAILHLLGVK
jgi:hypothetical protein